MGRRYRYKLLFYYLLIISFFGVLIGVFQCRYEKQFRKEALEGRLSSLTQVVNAYLADSMGNYKEVSGILPLGYRLTLINLEGLVLFDNSYDADSMDNHRGRPEIQQALLHGTGSALRYSKTMGKDYFYYIEKYPRYFVRISMPYDDHVESLLRVDSLFFYVILLFFGLGLLMMLFFIMRMDKGVARLKEFIRRVNAGESYASIQMPDSQLGDIGRELMENYRLLEESNHRTAMEREKLLQHFMHATEGVALFDADQKLLYSNTHFIQYINLLRDEPVIQLEQVLEFEEFSSVKPFLNEAVSAHNAHSIPSLEFRLVKEGACFLAKVLLFPDKSFEISLHDVSKQEENQVMKQQMTSNIAHELRTPVSSIQGYVETLLRNPNLPAEQQHRFLTRTYDQCERLSQLIQSITQISTLGEQADVERMTRVNLHDLFDDAVVELAQPLQEAGSEVINRLPSDLFIVGDRQLLFSIWRNLLENSLRYGGSRITMCAELSATDERYIYLVYYDTGVGVSQEHLSRLFERFYRVDSGRTRIAGGSGLGLAIVKNAVLRHGGQVSAKLHKPKGLEFVISLAKGKE